mmetsp:Transcript_152/g.476  ORF Transcript_152/g.476 Transcript_152/m.476 type:complete len:236 (-) Transcript_152:14-721(-)
MLRNNEHVAVRVGQAAIEHALVGCVHVNSIAALRGRRPGAAKGVHAVNKVRRGAALDAAAAPIAGPVLLVQGGRQRQGSPPQLVGGREDVTSLLRDRAEVPQDGRRSERGLEGLVRHRGPDAVEPRAQVARPRRRERGAGELLRVETVGALLRAVAADGQRFRQGFGAHAVAEAVLVAQQLPLLDHVRLGRRTLERRGGRSRNHACCTSNVDAEMAALSAAHCPTTRPLGNTTAS